MCIHRGSLFILCLCVDKHFWGSVRKSEVYGRLGGVCIVCCWSDKTHFCQQSISQCFVCIPSEHAELATQDLEIHPFDFSSYIHAISFACL